MPLDIQDTIINYIDEICAVASLYQGSRHFKKTIDKSEKLSFYQRRIEYYLREFDGEDLLNKMVENVEHFCYQTSSIRLHFVDSDDFNNKIEKLATLLNENNCKQYPYLYIIGFASQDIMTRINPRFKIEIDLSSLEDESKEYLALEEADFEFFEGTHTINLSHCSLNIGR